MISLQILSLALTAAVSSCTKPPVDQQASTAGGATQPAISQSPPPGPFNFPSFTPEQEKEIRMMKPGARVPVKIDRHYFVLRGAGMRIEAGDYFVQLLSLSTGRVTRFLLSKKRGTKVNDVDLKTGKATDGSFAMILDFAHEVEGMRPYTDTRAYCVSTGESSSVWVHVAGGNTEWQGELFGLAGPSDKLQRHQ
jgi:hypothetical protein